MRKLWWSSVLPLTATLCLTLASTASAAEAVLSGTGPLGDYSINPQAGDRRPGLIDPSCGLIGGNAVQSAACDSQGGREWEGIASTDYFTFEPSVFSPPNPDIAVGPDDILTVVNRTIARYPNPNAPSASNPSGTAPVTYNPLGTNYFPPTSRNFLDVWLGESAVVELCPSQPRSNASCVFDNASVRYDQMQGRFVILFTVVDTGFVNCDGCFGLPGAGSLAAGMTRKASWVLVSSRWATGCQASIPVTGTNIGGAVCTPNTTPAVPGLVGNTEFFTTPQPPGPNQSNPNSGGLNSNWTVIFGAGDGSCGANVSGGATTCQFGNINSISDLRRGQTFTGAAVRTIDCTAAAFGAQTSRVCYFPSSARLGIDNDNITIVSSVYDDNVAIEFRGHTPGLTPAWQGTRLRVWKKAAVYTGVSSVTGSVCSVTPGTFCAGASQATPQLQGDFYDLFDPASAYTFDVAFTQTLPGGQTRFVRGLNYEPEHVRGRSLASFNGNANTATSATGGTAGGAPFSSIWGAVSQGATITTDFSGLNPPQTQLYHRPIIYTRTVAGSLGANVQSIPSIVNNAVLVGGIPTLGLLQTHTVPQFYNPDSVIQHDKLTQPNPNAILATPYLYVGDDRPHRVISREGHRYIARVATLPNYVTFNPAVTSNATVTYDIVQKLTPTGAAAEVYNTSWGNGNYYAPMFDMTANVVQYGSVSPVGVLPYLEKLFVGTTYPALALSDSRTFSYGLISATSLQNCKGQEPSVTTGSSATATANARAFPGLFDIRCGEDAYDAFQSYRHPVTGAFTPGDFQITRRDLGNGAGLQQIVPFGIRGGAATDPNTLAPWYYGAYAKARLSSTLGFGQWGTYVAHYPLTFPIRDAYNNLLNTYQDVQQLVTDCSSGTCVLVQPTQVNLLFPYVQISKQTEIQPGSRTDTTFGVNLPVTRAEMARWTIRAQMDEKAVTDYINTTGGRFCSFADVQCPGSDGAAVSDTTGTAGDWRYIELMYRRGYTKGCEQTNDGQRRFCPTRTLTRGEMAVFIIRAKMNSVFPTVTSGAFTTTSCFPPNTQVTQIGDQFGLFTGCNPYFGDVGTQHSYFAFVQKMRELRISNGTSFSPATYSPEATLTRGQLMTFLIRAFFP